MNRTSLILGFLTGIIFAPQRSNAQYTANFQTNIISGVTSNWIGDYYVGYTNFADVLTIESSGIFSNAGFAYLGYDFGSSNNNVLVSGAGSALASLAGGPIVGNFGAANTMMISNGGCVIGLHGSVGKFASSSNNAVFVTGSGSVWSNTAGALSIGDTGSGNRVVISDGGKLLEHDGALTIGNFGAANSLVISNGGMVVDTSATVANSSGSSNNSILVTDPGSVWSNSSSLIIGLQSAGHSLVISNGGQVVNGNSGLGTGFGVGGSRSITVLVTGANSLWRNDGTLNISGKGTGNKLIVADGGQVLSTYAIVGGLGPPNSVLLTNGGVWQSSALVIGYQGSSNSLVILDGTLTTTNVLVGVNSPTCNNWVELDSGSVTVTNATADATFEVRQGKLILNGGTLQVDRFVMTNACAQFVRTGGTLLYGTAVLDPNASAVGDGIPNGWKQQYGLDPLDPNVANTDSDGDGMSNLQEYLAGTDPTNNASAFRIVEITPLDEDILLTWTTVGGKKYAVQFVDGGYTNCFNEYEPIIIAPGSGESTFSVIDPGAVTNGTARFYRIRLVP
jgi:T5SS/PEP-CTERM-associated repeat protein